MNRRFLHIIKSSKPVLVDFYADWCGPCRQVPPILKEVKEKVKNVKVIKVNVDKNPFIASQFNVHRIPTLIIFKNGRPLWTGEGVFSVDELETILHRRINGN